MGRRVCGYCAGRCSDADRAEFGGYGECGCECGLAGLAEDVRAGVWDFLFGDRSCDNAGADFLFGEGFARGRLQSAGAVPEVTASVSSGYCEDGGYYFGRISTWAVDLGSDRGWCGNDRVDALGVPFAVVLGVVAGITELIPIVGPLIGAAVAILVTLATAPDKLIWVALLYLGVQLVENTLLVPRVQSDTLNIHPIVVIVVIIVGGHFFGIWGIIFVRRWCLWDVMW